MKMVDGSGCGIRWREEDSDKWEVQGP